MLMANLMANEKGWSEPRKVDLRTDNCRIGRSSHENDAASGGVGTVVARSMAAREEAWGGEGRCGKDRSGCKQVGESREAYAGVDCPGEEGLRVRLCDVPRKRRSW